MKKKIYGFILLSSLVLFLWGCSIHNKTNSLVNNWVFEKESQHIEQENEISETMVEKDKKTNHLFCWKHIEIFDLWELISENNNNFIIKTDKQDSEGYDVYINSKVRWDELLISEEFLSDIVSDIDCAPWICYWIKINNTTMCWIDIEIYSDQPKPNDFPDTDWARYPVINSYDIVANQVWVMLRNTFY